MDKNNKRLGIITFIFVGIVIVLGFISLIVSNPIGRIVGNAIVSGYHFDDYNNDDVITRNYSLNCNNWSDNFANFGYSVHVNKCGGVKPFFSADISSETDVTFNINLKANRGRAKVVLVNHSTQRVVILKEVIHGELDSCEENIKAHCLSGKNEIKIVMDNFGGSLEISEKGSNLFKNIGKNMFDDKFPVGDEDPTEDSFPFWKKHNNI